MKKVVDIESKMQHISGKAFCRSCKAFHHYTIPLDIKLTVWLNMECPYCNQMSCQDSNFSVVFN